MPDELTDKLLHQLRRPGQPRCGHAARVAVTARGAFVEAADLAGVSTAAAGSVQADAALTGMCRQLEQLAVRHRQEHQPLGPHCRLLARKFLNTTVAAALAAAAPCESMALVLNNGTCPGETPMQAALRRAWRRAAPYALLLLGTLLLPVLAALCLGAVVVPAAVAVNGSRRGTRTDAACLRIH